jgi:DNA-binding HxlR family transcriptional regulator
VEKGSEVESNTSENESITSNVNYAPTDDEFNDKEDVIISADDKSKQMLIQKEGNKDSNSNNNNHDESSLSININDFLHNNDAKILSLLNQETGSNYSFKGLTRKLNLHQQSLTRALNRLEDLGLVEKSSVGYKLSKNGESIMMTLSTTTTTSKSNNLERSSSRSSGSCILQEEISGIAEKKGNDYVQLLQTYIPIDIKPDEIVHALIGKWFNNLRWVGFVESETGGGYMLQWVSDNNNNSFEIILRVISEYLIIETNAISDKEKVEAMIGSYRIFEQITKILRNKIEGLGILNMLDISSQYISKQNN